MKPTNLDPSATEQAALVLASAVVSCDELDDPRWTEIAMVFSLSEQGKNFGNSGYAYDADEDWWAVSLPVLAVRAEVVTYLKAFVDPLPKSLIKVLFQYDRETGETRVRPELARADRWSISPDSARQMVDILKPNFD